MTITHTAAILFALAGLVAAIAAAHYWWKASRVTIGQPVVSISDIPQLHIMSGHVAYNPSSGLNSRAAVLTGISAILSAIGSMLGVL